MPWIPANPVHAIDRALIKFEFGSLPTKALERVIEYVKNDGGTVGLTDVVTIQSAPSLQIIANSDGSQFVTESGSATSAKAFRNVDANGVVAEEAICTNEFLAFNINRYDGWHSISDRIARAFGNSIAYLTDNIDGIRGVRYEYWDRFVKDETSDESFVNPGTELLPSAFINAVGSWHSHVGFFKNSGRSKMLINANVDIISSTDVKGPAGLVHSLPPGVNSLCRIYSLALVTPETSQVFDSVDENIASAHLAHDELKSVIGDIINPALAARINLNAKAFVL
ncbi:hypothetical protein [Shinella sp.]|uniref:hypothetical protein n=1 Tax=Shinella sp. TaxID=1870904 RepID=UPI0029B266A4|nr:hypothetical protein [Shinella sp.]MDX3977026.1 hypothetical protein [Shinella sp.]